MKTFRWLPVVAVAFLFVGCDVWEDIKDSEVLDGIKDWEIFQNLDAHTGDGKSDTVAINDKDLGQVTDLAQATDPGAPQEDTNTDPEEVFGTGGCFDLWDCFMACADVDCQDDCKGEATENAQELLDAVFVCANDACQEFLDDEEDWLNCANDSLDNGGACESEISACLSDVTVVPTQPCGVLWDCFMGCDGDGDCQFDCSSQATKTANSLMEAVFDCFNAACTDLYGDDTAWLNCVNDAISKGGVCQSEMDACTADK